MSASPDVIMDSMDVRPWVAICLEERREAFKELLGDVAGSCRFCATPREVIRQCTDDAIRAILIDQITSSRLGVASMQPVVDMGIDLPALRVTPGTDGPVATCQAPFGRGSLAEVLLRIHDGDPAWKHPRYQRRHIRVPLRVRVRFRPEGSSEWRLANTTNASPMGAFLVTYRGENVGATLEIRLHDVLDEVTTMRGLVTWAQHWHDSPRLPGIGVLFEGDTVPETWRWRVADIHFARLTGTPGPRLGEGQLPFVFAD